MGKSLTVTVRIDLEAIVTCGDILQKQGVAIETQPISTTVRTFLEAITELMRETGQAPRRDREDLENTFQEMFRQELTPGEVDFSGLGNIISRKANAEDEISEIASKVDEILGPEGSRRIRRSVKESETVDPPKQGCDIFTLVSLADEDILKKSPKDRFAILLVDEKADSVTKQAIRVIYASLPVEQWGTDTAQLLIRDLIRQHQV